jgi:hypothetical protein
MLSDQRVFEAAAFVGDWWQLARLVWSERAPEFRTAG